jgi:sarcosine oxidase subunit gamma
VPSLIAKSPLSGQFPVRHGGISLSEAPLEVMTSLQPLPGQEKGLAKLLKGIGLGFPAPNTLSSRGDHLLVWTGRNQAFLIGAAPVGLTAVAAITDQSDGWARLRVEGVGAADVLMRLVPLDMRSFGAGRAARVPLNHMQAVVMCRIAGQFDLLVFRSMARTAWTEIEEAMQKVVARSTLAR